MTEIVTKAKRQKKKKSRTNAGKHDLLSTDGLRDHFIYVFILSAYFIASLDFITIFCYISILVMCVCVCTCVCVRART